MKLKEIMDTGKLNFTGMKTLFEGVANGTLKITEDGGLLVDVSTAGQQFKDIGTAIDGNVKDVVELLNCGDVKDTRAEKPGKDKVLVVIQIAEETFIHEGNAILFGITGADGGEKLAAGVVGRTNVHELVAVHEAMKRPIAESAVQGHPLGDLLKDLRNMMNEVGCDCNNCDKEQCGSHPSNKGGEEGC